MWCARGGRRICRARMTASPAPRTRRPTCSAASIASTAFRAASRRHGIIAAPTALLRTEAGTMTPRMKSKKLADPRRTLCVAGALIGLSVALGACKPTPDVVTTSGVPDDYRLRHPIAVQEANRSIVIFVGQGRGGLTAPQRTDVAGLAQIWLREGTGGIVADAPVATANARAAAESYREIRSILAARGVPSNAIMQRRYTPDDPRA